MDWALVSWIFQALLGLLLVFAVAYSILEILDFQKDHINAIELSDHLAAVYKYEYYGHLLQTVFFFGTLTWIGAILHFPLAAYQLQKLIKQDHAFMRNYFGSGIFEKSLPTQQKKAYAKFAAYFVIFIYSLYNLIITLVNSLGRRKYSA
uniref:Cornichon n=1 Tax=Palpitomonas bilix TaxID=652834 RepID=A0A7S3D5U6_9EUKA|mmetsp:Transcript_23552/g.59421  ORF Transcript_23552/g.59421 Transcript_23552/m.59421 type:complete len:149 (+) Transcript_23552:277-723(+)